MMINIETVNDLVKLCFGEGFKGSVSIDGLFFGNVKILDYPCQIAKRTFHLPRVIDNWEYAGRFTNKDASELEVKLKYRDSAEEYKREYEERFRNKVTITYTK